MKLTTRRHFLKQLGGGLLAAGLVASYPFVIERYLVLTNMYRIPVPHLPEAFYGFRIVHLTDLHYGPLVPLAVIRYVVHRTNHLGRDLVVCTGDYIHIAFSEIDVVWPVLAQLHAPFGVFSTLGNHDHWVHTERSQQWLEASNQDLRHKVKGIQKDGHRLWFGGAGDLWEDHVEIDHLMRNVPDSECKIVLAHNPDTADTNFSAQVDLMISGHTHGGQVNIPFVGPAALPVANKTYSNGLKKSPRGLNVFISKGIGWAGFPARFNCAPEIAVLELVPDNPKQG